MARVVGCCVMHAASDVAKTDVSTNRGSWMAVVGV